MMTPKWPILISPSLEELIKCLFSLYQFFKNIILIIVYFMYTWREAVEVRRGHQISCSWSSRQVWAAQVRCWEQSASQHD